MSSETTSSSEPSIDAKQAVATTIPNDILRLLGKPAVLRNENVADYQALLSRLAGEFNPKDVCEWMFIRDMAESLWDQQRMQRIRMAMIDKAFPDAACKLIRTIRGAEDALKKKHPKWSLEDLVAGMLQGDKGCSQAIDSVLSWQDYTRDTVMVEVMEQIRTPIAAVDQIIHDTQRRYRAVIRDFERYRLAWTQQRKRLTSPVTDLDPAEVVG